MLRSHGRRCVMLIAALFLTAATDSRSATVGAKPATQAKPAAHHPNILFIVLDDVGIDQMSAFGYGGATAPRMPNVDAIANAGVRFRNFWTMPECSPSRALMFEGRFPLRTNVYDAILSVDLANSQVSPYETTTPKLLKQAGYINGLFGKFHLTGSNADDHRPTEQSAELDCALSTRLGLFCRLAGRWTASDRHHGGRCRGKHRVVCLRLYPEPHRRSEQRS